MSKRMKTARPLSLLGIAASSFLASCALLAPSEPPADRWATAFVGTWESEGSGRYDRAIWILGDGGELRVENLEERDGQPPRTIYSWSGSWWTQPTGDSGTARELCYVRRHGRNAWCEEYELTTDPGSGATTLIRLEGRTFRPRRSS